MEFGRVEENELSTIDFSLPAEPAFNKKILSSKPAKQAKVYLGCAKWGRPEWVGKIYPPKTKEKNCNWAICGCPNRLTRKAQTQTLT